jgi:hypothetical protein
MNEKAPSFPVRKCDSFSMPRQNKPKGRFSNENAGQKGDGRIVCALCGRSIKEDGNAEQSVIYSICATCKKLPHRNPGSTASLN